MNSSTSDSKKGISPWLALFYIAFVTAFSLFIYAACDETHEDNIQREKDKAMEAKIAPVRQRLIADTTEKAQAIFAAKMFFKKQSPDAEYRFETTIGSDKKFDLIQPLVPGIGKDYHAFIGGNSYALDLGLTLDEPVKIWIPFPANTIVESVTVPASTELEIKDSAMVRRVSVQ